MYFVSPVKFRKMDYSPFCDKLVICNGDHIPFLQICRTDRMHTLKFINVIKQ